MPRIRPETAAIGLGLIGLGVLGALSNLGRLDFIDTARTWWPSILVVWGALELLDAASRKPR